MKKGIFYIILFAAILSFAGCKEDVPTVFAEPDGIYFNALADSMTYTFAKHPKRVTDTLKIPVTVLGKAAGTDRTISIEKVSSLTPLLCQFHGTCLACYHQTAKFRKWLGLQRRQSRWRQSD